MREDVRLLEPNRLGQVLCRFVEVAADKSDFAQGEERVRDSERLATRSPELEGFRSRGVGCVLVSEDNLQRAEVGE